MKAFILNEEKTYEDELRKLGVDITDKVDEATDLFLFGKKHLQIDVTGKKLHLLEEDMMPANRKLLAERLLQEGKDEQAE